MSGKGQAFAEFAVVVQFAVEDDSYIASFIPDGLLAAREINDAEPPQAQCQAGRARIVHKKSVFVGAAMAHGRSHHAHARLRFAIVACISEPTDSAHVAILSRVW